MIEIVQSEISSKENKIVKYASALLTGKGRKKEGAYRFDGIKLFAEGVRCGIDFDALLVNSAKKEAVINELDRRIPEWKEMISCRIFFIKDSIFSSISEENAPEGIICIAKSLDKSKKSGTIIRRENFSWEKNFIIKANEKEKRIMAAEALRDPGNLGTLIRTCKGLGVDKLMLSDDCADILSPKVIRSSMGAVFSLETEICENLPLSLVNLKADGRRILATALYGEAVSLSNISLNASDVFVIGNEGHGLSSEILGIADECVYIDMYSGPGCESLNAGVAAAICAWEQKRQTETGK